MHASGGRVGAVMSVQADEIARRLNQYVPERENVERDCRTYTALMWAARQGHDAIVAELLRAGADITLTSRNGSTALSLARKYGHEKCVELLEKARDARKSRGSSAKVQTRTTSCSRLVPGSCLDACPTDVFACQAPRRGNATALCNTKDQEGKTAAHAAAANGHADSLRVVHNGGGDLSCADDEGCVPAHYAAMHGHDRCLAIIVDVAADFRSKNIFGFTPLRLALRNRHITCATLLRDAIAKMDDF